MQYQRFLVEIRKDGLESVLKPATAWLDAHKNWSKYDGYQGIELLVAKAELEAAAKLKGEKKRALTQVAMKRLNDVGKSNTEYQQEAILLRREQTHAEPTDVADVKTFDEAVAVGEAAAENLDWPTAVAALRRALEMRSTVKDATRVAAVEARLDLARYQLAAADFAAEKYDQCAAGAQALVDERPDGPLAPKASALAVTAALALYAKADDKRAALAHVESAAQKILERWPDKPEADDARIALGQAKLVRGELPAAIEIFERVNPRSLRYAAAMHLAGQTHWRRYLAAKGKAGGDEAAEAVAAERAAAEERLQLSLDEQRKAADPGKPLERQMLETQLLLAEVELEGGADAKAAELVGPLLDWIATQKPTLLDNTLLRVFVTAVRANLALGDMAKAQAAAELLVAQGPDDELVDGVLYTVARLFDQRWKQAQAQAIEARTARDTAGRAAAEKLAGDLSQRLTQLLAKITVRKHFTLAATIFIADTSAELGQTDAARKLYESILAQGDADAAFTKANGPALTRIRAQLVGLLRQKKEYQQGLTEVDRLIAEYPNALEPKMEKGRLLQDWAEVEPSHFNEAVAHWTMLRTRLAKFAKKPPEYYEVVYNAASCLVTESFKTQSAEKALQAEQLLNATLVLSPKLSGPDMVARYKAQLAKARELRGVAKSAAAKSNK